MEISFAYRIRSETPERDSKNITQSSVALSPKHSTFCIAKGNFLHFSSNEKTEQICLDLTEDECVTCVGTVHRFPWIVGVGTNFGRLILVSYLNSKVIKSIDLHRKSVAVEIKETPENENNSIISVVLKPNIIVLIPSDDIFAIVSNPNFKPALFKVSIDCQENITSCSVIFPRENDGRIKLYTTCPSNLLTASYFSKPQSAGALSKLATTINIFGKSFSDSEPNRVLSTIFSIGDGDRCVSCMRRSPGGRYMALVDTYGRLSILDTETDNFLLTRKDLAEAQLAWCENDGRLILVVLSEKRRCIYIVRFPEMKVADAISIEEGGKLLQNFDLRNKTCVVYVDKNGNIAILKPRRRRAHAKKEEIVEKSVDQFFKHEELSINVEKNENVIQEVINNLCNETADEEAIVRILNDIDDVVLASQVISTIIKFDNVSDDFLKHCISVLQLSLDYSPVSPPSLRRQIDNYIDNFKGSDIIPEDEFARYISLTEIWTKAMLIEQEVIPISQFPQTAITKWYTHEYEIESVGKPEYLPLRLFLTEPMKNFGTLFASLRKDATHHDLIKIMMAVHPSSIDELLRYFVYWCATITPSHLALIQNVIIGLSQYNLRDAMIEQYNSIPDGAAENNKLLFMRILSE